MTKKKDEVLGLLSFDDADGRKTISLSVLFNRPHQAFSLREWWAEVKRIRGNLFKSLGGMEKLALSLERTGHVIMTRGRKKGTRWEIRLTDKGFNEFRESYVRSRNEHEDWQIIRKLLEEGAEWIVSSPRTITLFGEYAIADSTTDLPAKALGMTINSRTYIGFRRTGSSNEHKVGKMFLFRNKQWDSDSWPETGVKNLEEWYDIVRKEWNELRPEKACIQTNYPSIIVVADCPGNIGLHLSASAMPAFATGLLLFFQTEDKLERNLIRTTHGELSDNEKQIIQKVAVECEKLYARRRNARICSGIHSMISTQGGIVYFERAHATDEVSFTSLEFPKEQFPIAIVEPAEREKHPTPAAIAQVLEYKNKLAEIDEQNLIFETVYKIMNRVTTLSKKYVESFDLRKLGKLMTIQHQLLRMVGASDASVELLLLKIADLKIEGILGTKITGAGGKGSSILILYNPTCFGKNLNKELFSKLRTIRGVLAERVMREKGVSIEIPPICHDSVKIGPRLSDQDKAQLVRRQKRD